MIGLIRCAQMHAYMEASQNAQTDSDVSGGKPKLKYSVERFGAKFDASTEWYKEEWEKLNKPRDKESVFENPLTGLPETVKRSEPSAPAPQPGVEKDKIDGLIIFGADKPEMKSPRNPIIDELKPSPPAEDPNRETRLDTWEEPRPQSDPNRETLLEPWDKFYPTVLLVSAEELQQQETLRHRVKIGVDALGEIFEKFHAGESLGEGHQDLEMAYQRMQSATDSHAYEEASAEFELLLDAYLCEHR